MSKRVTFGMDEFLSKGKYKGSFIPGDSIPLKHKIQITLYVGLGSFIGVFFGMLGALWVFLGPL